MDSGEIHSYTRAARKLLGSFDSKGKQGLDATNPIQRLIMTPQNAQMIFEWPGFGDKARTYDFPTPEF